MTTERDFKASSYSLEPLFTDDLSNKLKQHKTALIQGETWYRLKDFLKRYPINPDVLRAMARVKCKAGRYTTAIRCDDTEEIFVDYPTAFNVAGVVDRERFFELEDRLSKWQPRTKN